jgi:hypothetical protein
MTNYERHPTMRGYYIAYDATGFAFRIRKACDWLATPSYAAAAGDYRLFTGPTLRAVAAKVAASNRAAA